MPLLDACIGNMFEPGNIGSSSGTPPTVIVPGSGLDPGTYDPESVINSLDFSKFYNSMYLLLLMAGGGPATLPGPTGGGGGGAGGGSGAPAGDGNISLLLAEQQATLGYSEGLPKDLPSDYSWYYGDVGATMPAPPSGFTAMTGYGVVYQMLGTPDDTIPGMIEVRNFRSYVRLTADKSWVQVQDQTTLEGGHFVADFTGNEGGPMTLNDIGGGVWEMDGPPIGYNNHWWANPRGEYTADTVDGTFCIYEMRVTDPAASDLLVALCGIDWWLDVSAGYVEGFTNNPGASGSTWITLTTTFKPVSSYSAASYADFELSLPPPVIA